METARQDDIGSKTKAKVFYDGLCRVCAAEIQTYQKMKGAEAIDFVDITLPSFDAKKEGLDPFLVHKELHGKDEEGNWHVGVAAFIMIWARLPSLKWLSRWAQKAWLNSFLQMNYKVFVKIRPYLPRKSCEESPYCPIKK